MSQYILRLDDAAPRHNVNNWNYMEQLLDFYDIKPLVGVIPDCQDDQMQQYELDSCFWERVNNWQSKGWEIALHGYDHVYCTKEGGINPVNQRSEFAGISLQNQKKKISEGINIFKKHGIATKVFFAPSHTFDKNTIVALLENHIKIISDTVANKPYKKYGITFVPQQSGVVRKLPFHTVTFCYHPNIMTTKDFDELEKFLCTEKKHFIAFPTISCERKASIYDVLLQKLYFAKQKLKVFS